MAFEYVRQYYEVPAEYNRIIEMDGRRGIIVEDRGHHLGVLFDGNAPGDVRSVHPTDKVKYLGFEIPRKMTRSQKRYQEYLDNDYFDGTFADWLGIKT